MKERVNYRLASEVVRFVEKAAEEDCRSMSGQVEWFLRQAARNRGVDLEEDDRDETPGDETP